MKSTYVSYQSNYAIFYVMALFEPESLAQNVPKQPMGKNRDFYSQYFFTDTSGRQPAKLIPQYIRYNPHRTGLLQSRGLGTHIAASPYAMLNYWQAFYIASKSLILIFVFLFLSSFNVCFTWLAISIFKKGGIKNFNSIPNNL